MSKRALYLTRVAVVAAMAGFPVLVPAPAGALPNGLDVNCNPEPGEANTAICVISGCPRVHGDYVVDAVHWKIDGGEQQEEGFKCINGATTRFTLGGLPGRTGTSGCRLAGRRTSRATGAVRGRIRRSPCPGRPRPPRLPRSFLRHRWRSPRPSAPPAPPHRRCRPVRPAPRSLM